MKIGPRGPSGTRLASRPPVLKKSLRREWIFGVTSGVISETFWDLFRGVFLKVFGEVPFSLLGAIGAPKAPKRVPKGSPK